MTRVALVLSGQPKFFDGVSYESLKYHFISKYNADVYLHFWWDWNNGEIESSPWSGLTSSITLNSETPHKLLDLYKPKGYLMQEPVKFDNSSYMQRNGPSMFLSMKMAAELVPKGKYDIIVRTRYDMHVIETPDLTSLDMNTFYVPNNCPNSKVCSDNLSISNEERFRQSCSVYDHLSFFKPPFQNETYYHSTVSKFGKIEKRDDILVRRVIK